MTLSIIPLSGQVPVEESAPAADRLLAGNPCQRAWNFFSDRSGRFHVGRWSSTPGRWRVRYTEHELCVMTAGRVVLRGSAGEQLEFVSGDAFVVPAGFEGTWEVLEECVKIYAILLPA
ncbi:MAG: cupin domain-containing protein [Terracidiphilus sp.]|jgi:uncharacterized cupin superfamily protein